MGPAPLHRIRLAWIVSSPDPRSAVATVREGIDLGYHAFKVKLGLGGEQEDLALVKAVRQEAKEAYLWVDANQGYRPDAAIRQARRMQDLEVGAFEQPLPANDIVGLRRLREVSPIPIALDESLRHPSDLATFIKLDAVDVAVAKVQRSGGLTLSRRLCSLAEEAGLRLMGSGLTESNVGLAASLQLFAAFGVDLPVDLNGRQFLKSPYTDHTAIRIEDGAATVPAGPGLGVDVDEQTVRCLARKA